MSRYSCVALVWIKYWCTSCTYKWRIYVLPQGWGGRLIQGNLTFFFFRSLNPHPKEMVICHNPYLEKYLSNDLGPKILPKSISQDLKPFCLSNSHLSTCQEESSVKSPVYTHHSPLEENFDRCVMVDFILLHVDQFDWQISLVMSQI